MDPSLASRSLTRRPKSRAWTARRDGNVPCVRRHPLQTLSQTAQARKRPTSVSTHHPQEELEELVKHLPGHRVVSIPASVEVAGSCRGRCRRVCCRPACAARLAPRRFSGALRAPDAEHAAVRPLDLTIRSCNAVGIDRQPGPGAVGRRKRGRSLAPRNRRHLLDRGGSTPDRQGLRPESHAFIGAAGSSSAHCLRRLGHRWQATVPWWRATVTMGVCDYYRDAVRQ